MACGVFVFQQGFMAKITYITFTGEEHVVDVLPGATLMHGAKDNNIPGIDADCGGACVCGTCHVYIDPSWWQHLSTRTEIETATIEFSSDVKENSRLACQIKISEDLDGLVVRMPETQ
jgi:2Fe-2S ferredoxin